MTAALALIAAVAAIAIGALYVRLRRRMATLERNAADVAAQHENRAQARLAFLGSMAHELRTPLAAIVGYQELLSEGIYGPLEARTGEAIARIGRAGIQLGHLIDGMVELVGEEEYRTLELERVQPADVLREVLDDLATLAADAGLELQTDVPANLPTITTDARRFSRAVFLTTFAAVRATRAGTLDVRVHPNESGVVVTLDGSGVPTAALPPADTASAFATGHGYGGASLRLTIARATARSLGGDLRLEAAPGGSRLVLHVADMRGSA